LQLRAAPRHGPGRDRLPSASCRVPVDGAGQLQRVFQAAGEDPSAAADKLLHDVHSWRSGAPAAAPRTVRF